MKCDNLRDIYQNQILSFFTASFVVIDLDIDVFFPLLVYVLAELEVDHPRMVVVTMLTSPPLM